MGPYASFDYVNNNFGIANVRGVTGSRPDSLQTVSCVPHNPPAGMSYATTLWQRPQNLSVFAQWVSGRALMKMQVYLIVKPTAQPTAMPTARLPHSIRRFMEYSRLRAKEVTVWVMGDREGSCSPLPLGTDFLGEGPEGVGQAEENWRSQRESPSRPAREPGCSVSCVAHFPQTGAAPPPVSLRDFLTGPWSRSAMAHCKAGPGTRTW